MTNLFKSAKRIQQKLQPQQEAPEPKIPDYERLKRTAMKKKRTGGRASTILTGKM